MTSVHERFMRAALAEAARGGAEGNIAVGSVVVRDDTVVAGGRNLEAATNDPTAHAEVVAVREASRALGRRDLSGHTLYTTFEPCPMCCGAIMASGITTLARTITTPESQARGRHRLEGSFPSGNSKIR